MTAQERHATQGLTRAPMSPSLELSAVVPPAFKESNAFRVGLPSRWLRKEGKEGKDLKKDSQKLTLHRLCTQLTSEDPKLRQEAAESLAHLCQFESFASGLADDLRPVLHALKPVESVPVKLAILGAFRSLAEKGHATAVALHSSALLPCLKDDILVQRKVSALYRVLAEEGAASMVAQDVKSLMDCFEATQAHGAPLAAPLDALSAIAIAGEGSAVASVIEPLLKSLKDSRPKIRLSACATLGAVASGGDKELLASLGLSAEAEGPGRQATLFEMLVCTALDDQDDEVRLEAADALRCLPESDRSDARQRFPRLVQRLRAKPFTDRRGRRGEAMRMVSDAVGITCGSSRKALEGTLCAICQEPLQTDSFLLCPEGDPRTLHCGHTFHEKCCQNWFAWVTKCGRTPSCPVCRAIGHE